MAPYFRKLSNTRFGALRTGIFRMAYHGINEACGCKRADRSLLMLGPAEIIPTVWLNKPCPIFQSES